MMSRKIPCRIGFLCALIMLLSAAFRCKTSQTAGLYPAPDPGDLSGIEGLEKSPLFDLTINGRDAFVYRGFETEYNNYGYARKGCSFVNFAFAPQRLTLRVTTTEAMRHVTVRPHVDHRQPDANTLELTLDTPRKFMITADFAESGENYFVISAETPETDVPDRSDPSVLYLEAGVHRFGRTWSPFENGIQTVYLAPGAVVQATMHTVGQSGLTLRGRGVFAQAVFDHAKKIDSQRKAEWMGDMMGIYFRNCRDLVIEGITVVNAPSYQIELANCEQVHVHNIKLLGCGEGNNDGIHLYGRHIRLEDSFLAGSDDRICITGLYDAEAFEVEEKSQLIARLTDTEVHDIRIRNIVFWGQKNGADVMMSWNGGQTVGDVMVDSVFSLSLTNKGFVACKHGGSVVLQDMLFKNAHLYHHRLVDIEVKEASCWGAGGGSVRNLRFENITLDAEPGEVSNKIIGYNETSDVRNIRFENIRANGQRITDIGQTRIETNAFVENIQFE